MDAIITVNLEIIRISCAALCRIEIDEKFLLEINKNRGDVLTPIGGALEFYPSALPFLESLGAAFERGNDLRFTIPRQNLHEFQRWFALKENRENDPLRELREELIDEHRILPRWPGEDPVIHFLRLVEHQATTTRKGQEGMLTYYFYEIFSVTLTPSLRDACLKAVIEPNSKLYMACPMANVAGVVEGIRLAQTSRFVMEY